MKIDLNEAILIIEENVKKINKTNIIDIKNINNDISAVNVYSNINTPPFDRSPLDGYALHSDDTLDSEVYLSVVGEVFAGESSDIVLEKNSAVRIMTGAKIPSGANCVIRQEHTETLEDKIVIRKKLKPFENICFEGEDIKKGTEVIKKGEKLNFAEKGILASVGVFEIEVYKKPSVLLIITGDEVMEKGELLPGKIYDSNSYLLSGRLNELGIYDIKTLYVSDDEDKILHTLQTTAQSYDLVITTGGVSVGKKDFMPFVVEKLGAIKKFHGLDLKPGSPVMFSMYKSTPILSLSGNPFACIATFEILAKPILYKLTENDFFLNKIEKSVLGTKWSKSSDKQRFIRAVEKNGKVFLPENNSSGSIFTLKNCNCLIVIEKGNKGLDIGDEVKIIRF